ncbi:MAG: hypothetical protein ABEH35_04850 [Haloarculaceae archaeon]
MADRLPSDHDTVETHRGRVGRAGGTRRARVELPAALSVSAGDVIRLVLDGEEYHARIDTDLDGEPVIDHAADNARLARERAGTNRLAAWLSATDREPGDSVDVDVVTRGYKYGVRTPGQRVVYTATDAPDSSLADIARDVDG